MIRRLSKGIAIAIAGSWIFTHASASDTSSNPAPAGENFLDKLTSGKAGPEMVGISKDNFLLGSPPSEKGRDKNEGPQIEIRISSFAIGKYEVSVEQFEEFVSATGYQTTAETSGGCWTWGLDSSNFGTTRYKWIVDDDLDWQTPGFEQTKEHPVVCTSWGDATAYANWLSRETGESYRLPSEAEWEYANRAGSSSAYFWGNEISREYLNYGGDKCCKGLAAGNDKWINTAPAGSFSPNKLGLYDTHGNVTEWTADCWHNDHEHAPVDGEARGPENGGDCSFRVARGGSWIDTASKTRAARRLRIYAEEANIFTGFRVARDW